jgi:FdhD protein
VIAVAKQTRSHPVLRSDARASESRELELIGEEPLLIRIEDEPYAVVMRTRGDEMAHAAGFCLGEGIVDAACDFARIGYDEDADPNAVDVWLTSQRRDRSHELLKRRIFVSQTSCGICGKELIKDLQQIVAPVTDQFVLPYDTVRRCLDELSSSQQHYQTTRGSHAALILDLQLGAVAFAEDVGRHNALDKAIGLALLGGTLPDAAILVLSSRVSYELIQKAARAQLAVVISNSRPTSLAAQMGQSLNMTLAFPDGESGLITVCGAQRIEHAVARDFVNPREDT